MKKVISLIVLVLVVSFTSQAQRKMKNEDREPLSVEQKTTLSVKKLTLALDLTEKQQREVRPLIAEKIAKRKKMHEEFKARKESAKKLTKDERYERMNAKLDEKIAFKAKMKQILNKEQYEKYEKIAAKRMRKGKRKMKKHAKKRKHRKEHKN